MRILVVSPVDRGQFINVFPVWVTIIWKLELFRLNIYLKANFQISCQFLADAFVNSGTERSLRHAIRPLAMLPHMHPSILLNLKDELALSSSEFNPIEKNVGPYKIRHSQDRKTINLFGQHLRSCGCCFSKS